MHINIENDENYDDYDNDDNNNNNNNNINNNNGNMNQTQYRSIRNGQQSRGWHRGHSRGRGRGNGPPHFGCRNRYRNGNGPQLSSSQRYQQRRRYEGSSHQLKYNNNPKLSAKAGSDRPPPNGRTKHQNYQSTQNVLMDTKTKVNQLNDFKNHVTNVNNYNNYNNNNSNNYDSKNNMNYNNNNN